MTQSIQTVPFAHTRLDGTTATSLVRAARAAFSMGARVLVIDLAQVATIDSLGVAAIASLAELAPAGGEIRLANLGAYVRTVARVTHLDEIVQMYATVDAAMA